MKWYRFSRQDKGWHMSFSRPDSFPINKLLAYARWGMAILLILFLAWIADISSLIQQILAFDAFMIGLFVGGFFLILLLNALASWVLVNGFSSMELGKSLRYYVYSWSTEFFLPGKLGMFSIAYFWHREKIQLGESVAAILLHKIFMMIFLVLASLLGLATWLGGGHPYLYYIGAAIIGIMGTAIVLFTHAGRELIKKYFLAKHAVIFSGFSSTLRTLSKQPMRLLALSALMISIILVNGFMLQMAFQHVGSDVPFLYVVAAASTAMLVGIIPISINGLGVKEGTFTLLMSLIQISPSLTLAISALSTAIGYVMGLLASTLLVKEIPMDTLKKWLAENKLF